MGKEKANTGYSYHHLLPQSQNGSSNESNLILLKNTTHRAIHTLFQNQMFAQQLLTMVDINQSALRKDVINKLLAVLDNRDENDPFDRYKRSAIKF